MNSQKEYTGSCCMCGSSPSKDPSITLHRFPKPGSKNALRCELWAKYCFPNETWFSPEFQNGLHSKHKMLCSKHFQSTCFNENKLFRTAVPGDQYHKDTMISNLPDQLAILKPVAGTSRIYPLTEHNANIVTPSNSRQFVCESSKQEVGQKNNILIRKLKSKMNKVYRLQKTVKHLKNEAFLNVISNNDGVKEILDKRMSPTFALLLQGELQNYKRKKHGRL